MRKIVYSTVNGTIYNTLKEAKAQGGYEVEVVEIDNRPKADLEKIATIYAKIIAKRIDR